MWDFSIGKTLGIMRRTFPFILFRMAIFFGITLAYILATGGGAGIGWLVGHVGTEPESWAVWGGVFGLGAVSVGLYLLREWLLYMVKAAHIAVMVEALDGRELPNGQGQVAYGASVVKARFAEANILFVLDQLVKGVLAVITGTLTTIAFDKTGTLTSGTPAIASTSLVDATEQGIARTLAQRSIHPASRALVGYLGNVAALPVTDLHEVPGHGVEAIYKGKSVRLGRHDWVAEIANSDASHLESGPSFAIAGKPLRSMSLKETLREGAESTVATLNRRGIRTRLLSGDAPEPVRAIAEKLGIAAYFSQLKPGEKLESLRADAAAGHRTLMVGDGLNDAPALAAAHVSMAPSSAADVGRTAADMVFTRDSLQSIIFAHDVALATERVVRQNFALAIVYNIFAVPLAITGQLNPLIAAIAMSTSSIIVVANSLRLYRLKPKEKAARATVPVKTTALRASPAT